MASDFPSSGSACIKKRPCGNACSGCSTILRTRRMTSGSSSLRALVYVASSHDRVSPPLSSTTRWVQSSHLRCPRLRCWWVGSLRRGKMALTALRHASFQREVRLASRSASRRPAWPAHRHHNHAVDSDQYGTFAAAQRRYPSLAVRRACSGHSSSPWPPISTCAGDVTPSPWGRVVLPASRRRGHCRHGRDGRPTALATTARMAVDNARHPNRVRDSAVAVARPQRG